MSTFNLDVNATVTVSTLDEARMIGQAVEKMLGTDVRGGIKIHEVPVGRTHTLHELTYDKDAVVRIYPDVQAKAKAFVVEIVVFADHEGASVPSADIPENYWDEFMGNALNLGVIDYDYLVTLIDGVLGSNFDAAHVIAAVEGKIASDAVTRHFRNAAMQRSKAAKWAQNNKITISRPNMDNVN